MIRPKLRVKFVRGLRYVRSTNVGIFQLVDFLDKARHQVEGAPDVSEGLKSINLKQFC